MQLRKNVYFLMCYDFGFRFFIVCLFVFLSDIVTHEYGIQERRKPNRKRIHDNEVTKCSIQIIFWVLLTLLL